MQVYRLLFLLGLGAILLSSSACTSKVQGDAPGGALPVKVQTTQARKVGEYTEYLATIRSLNGSVIQPDVEGQVRRIFVRSGQHVKAGQSLMEIDPRKQEATVNTQEANRRAAQATLDYNQRELERRKQLFANGVISRNDLEVQQQAYEASKANVEALEAMVREQQAQLRYYSVNAPADGIVGDVPVRVGDRVTVQTVLTTLDRGNGLEAYISIPAEKSGDVRLGTPVELLDDSGKVVAQSRISFISPRVDTATQLLLLKAPMPEGKGFRNDQVVHLRLVWREVERTTIPVTAVARLGGQAFAFVAESKGNQYFAHQRPVRLGDIEDNYYIVLEGLKPGEKLITSGVQMLADGMPVAPQS